MNYTNAIRPMMPHLYLGDKDNGSKAPLNGEWKLLFTTQLPTQVLVRIRSEVQHR